MARKVLFISHSSEWNGAEHVLFTLVRGLSPEKYEPTVLVPGEGVLKKRLEEEGVRTLVFKTSWWVSGTPDLLQALTDLGTGLTERVMALRKLIEEENFDLVFTNTSVVIEGALAAKLSGRAHIWHVLELMGEDPSLFPVVPLSTHYFLLGSLSDHLIAVSEKIASSLGKYCESAKIRKVYNSVQDPQELVGQSVPKFDPKSYPSVCFVGTLCERKGVFPLVEAAREVCAEFPAAKFVIVGADGGAKDEMVRRIQNYQLEPSFEFLGFQEFVYEHIARSDVFVLPSLVDPMPLVVLEAMGLEKPVVATKSGGASEMVANNETGILVSPASSSELAGALIHLLRDPVKRKSMGEAGRLRMLGQFSGEACVRYIEKVMDEASLIQGKRVMSQEDAVALMSLIEEMCRDKAQMASHNRKLELQTHELEKMKSRIDHLEDFVQTFRSKSFYRLYRRLNGT
jgi:glycosyltransferase involved in cell wall biosynthesis